MDKTETKSQKVFWQESKVFWLSSVIMTLSSFLCFSLLQFLKRAVRACFCFGFISSWHICFPSAHLSKAFRYRMKEKAKDFFIFLARGIDLFPTLHTIVKWYDLVLYQTTSPLHCTGFRSLPAPQDFSEVWKLI